jgi:hypothetical protein
MSSETRILQRIRAVSAYPVLNRPKTLNWIRLDPRIATAQPINTAWCPTLSTPCAPSSVRRSHRPCASRLRLHHAPHAPLVAAAHRRAASASPEMNQTSSRARRESPVTATKRHALLPASPQRQWDGAPALRWWRANGDQLRPASVPRALAALPQCPLLKWVPHTPQSNLELSQCSSASINLVQCSHCPARMASPNLISAASASGISGSQSVGSEARTTDIKAQIWGICQEKLIQDRGDKVLGCWRRFFWFS